MNITAYDILELSADASLEDAKRAYHRLALQYHPDICKEPDAIDRMKNINLAYQAIKDGRGRWWSPPLQHTIPEPPEVQILADMIEWANTHVVTDDYLIRMFVGGRDAYSRLKLPDLEVRAGSAITQKVNSAFYSDRMKGTALRWYLRGLNIDLAIRKAHADDKFYRDKARNAS